MCEYSAGSVFVDVSGGTYTTLLWSFGNSYWFQGTHWGSEKTIERWEWKRDASVSGLLMVLHESSHLLRCNAHLTWCRSSLDHLLLPSVLHFAGRDGPTVLWAPCKDWSVAAVLFGASAPSSTPKIQKKEKIRIDKVRMSSTASRKAEIIGRLPHSSSAWHEMTIKRLNYSHQKHLERCDHCGFWFFYCEFTYTRALSHTDLCLYY